MKKHLISIVFQEESNEVIFVDTISECKVQTNMINHEVVRINYTIRHGDKLHEKSVDIICANAEDVWGAIIQDCLIDGKSLHIEENYTREDHGLYSYNAEIYEHEEIQDVKWWQFWKWEFKSPFSNYNDNNYES